MISAEFLKRLSEVNASRCVRWHGPNGVMDWSPERWCVATLGELGELALVATGTDEVVAAEAADTAIYAELFAQCIGVKLYEFGWEDPDVNSFIDGIRHCTGQLGEAANALKKAFRIEANMANISDKDRQIDTLKQAYEAIGNHLANLIAILDDMLFGNLEVAIIKKFNATSVKYNFPERL